MRAQCGRLRDSGRSSRYPRRGKELLCVACSTHLEPIAVVLHLVDPSGPEGTLKARVWDAGRNKASRERHSGVSPAGADLGATVTLPPWRLLRPHAFFVDRKCADDMLRQMTEGPRAEWFQAQALKCIGLARGATDAWTKWRYVLEAERWLHLAELQADHLIQTEYQGVERRCHSRHLARIAGAILLEGDLGRRLHRARFFSRRRWFVVAQNGFSAWRI